jgi:hypothetical protein
MAACPPDCTTITLSDLQLLNVYMYSAFYFLLLMDYFVVVCILAMITGCLNILSNKATLSKNWCTSSLLDSFMRD